MVQQSLGAGRMLVMKSVHSFDFYLHDRVCFFLRMSSCNFSFVRIVTLISVRWFMFEKQIYLVLFVAFCHILVFFVPFGGKTAILSTSKNTATQMY